MNPAFTSNVITLMICWAPIFGLVINYLPPFLSKDHVYWLAFLSLMMGLFVFFMEPFRAINYEFSKAYAMYCFYLALALVILPRRYPLGKSVAISLMMIFLVSEFHEIPAFIQMYLGWFDTVNAKPEFLVWFTPINHLYSLVVAFLMFRIAKIKVDWGIIFVLGLSVFETYLIYEIFKFNIYGFWQYLTRFVWIVAFLGILLMGEKRE